MDQFFSWERFFVNLPKLLQSLPVTFQIVLVATLAGIILGVLLAMIRIKRIPVLYQIAGVFISFMRGTPILVQMLVIFHGLPVLLNNTIGVDINRWERIVFIFITYALNQAAFLSEIFRSAITSIPTGQAEAGYSVGLTGFQTYYRIILPQAVRIALPGFGSDLIGLFQNTSLAYMIGIIDIMGKARTIGTNTQHVLECYIIVAIVFIVISLSVKGLFAWSDKKLTYRRR